ncbi:MAG: DUF1611 domain-containing protein [Lachnospiraceae bacterium]|nr:DUF1611 domain-containing protein [Lachnospiraceae bacterium]
MKIAIIDSGINGKVLNVKTIKQYRVYEQKVYEEECRDYVGHGTAVASVICKNVLCDIVSICPGINESGVGDRVIDNRDLTCAIELAIQEEVDVINISMGTTHYFEREKIDKVCEKAHEKGIAIFCAESTEHYPSLPWACKGVIRVTGKNGHTRGIKMEVADAGYMSVVVDGEFYRIIREDGTKYFAIGSSYASAYVINVLLNKQEKVCLSNVKDLLFTDTDEKKEFEKMISESVSFLGDCENNIFEKRKYGKLLLVPFIKEMHSIVRFLNEDVVAVVDSPKKGLLHRNVNNIMEIDGKSIEVKAKLCDVEEEIDTMVIGYTDQIEKYDAYFNLENLLQENLKYKKWNIYSFVPVDQKWIDKYRENGLYIDSPILIDERAEQQICELLRCDTPVRKPVVGVFGTSSAQGKLTLQMLMRKHMREKGVSPFFLSTEHQGKLLGADFTYADGYMNDATIQVPMEERVGILKKIMSYADNCTDTEVVLVGGQSRLIPYHAETQTFLRSAVFLEGVKPDLAVLVVNPILDPPQYIQDSISTLAALYKCETVALAYSDHTPKVDENGKFKKEKLNQEEEQEINKKLEERFGLMSGCITDDVFCSSVVDKVITILS